MHFPTRFWAAPITAGRAQVTGTRAGAWIRVHCDPHNGRRSVLIQGTNFASYVAIATASSLLLLVNNGICKGKAMHQTATRSPPALIEPVGDQDGILRFTASIEPHIEVMTRVPYSTVTDFARLRG